MTADRPPPEFLASIQPIVLVGGKSRRFGRDKLLEPWGHQGQVLVQRPIEALLAVFGPRVMLVGECHPAIIPLADGVIPDNYPGIGPIGGILAALEAWAGPVFVVAGDMPGVEPGTIETIVRAALAAPNAWATLAVTDRTHQCAGLYTQSCKPSLQLAIQEQRFKLASAIPETRVLLVPCPPDAVTNINSVSDMPANPSP